MQDLSPSLRHDSNQNAGQHPEDDEIALRIQLMRGYEDVLAGRVSPAADAMAAIRTKHGWNHRERQ